MSHNLDWVALTRDLDEYGLIAGDEGEVVHRYGEGDSYEVEFVTASGKTIAVATLTVRDVRPLRGQEILHVRKWVDAD